MFKLQNNDKNNLRNPLVHLKFSEPRNVEYNEAFLLICDEDVF